LVVDSKRIEEEAKRVREGSQDPRKPVPNFSYDNIPMDFSEARHLALTSYMTTTWSIYDRLANVCGRLAATDDIHGNPRKNPKLCDDLLARRKEKDSSQENRNGYGAQLFAFSMQHHLVSAYAWPAKVSYTLRNWLVHEGYEIGSVQIFLSNRIEDGLRLNPNAANHLAKVCDYSIDDNGNSAYCCITAALDPWNKQEKDLLAIIEEYHEQIDTMFAALVKWIVDSFVGQIDAFAQRDKTAIAAAATRMLT
jgi:hypothetical protein